MLFRHKNVKSGIVAIVDSKNVSHGLRPGEEVTIDREAVEARPYGIVCVEKIGQEKIEEIKSKPKDRRMM